MAGRSFRRVAGPLAVVGGIIALADSIESASRSLRKPSPARIRALVDDLVSQRGMGLMFISHDLNLVASFCDRVVIMYGGQIVETCKAADLHNAQHTYTRGLLASLPRVDRPVDQLSTLVREESWKLEPGVDARIL